MSKVYYLETFPGGHQGAVLQEEIVADNITEPMAVARSRSERDPGTVWAVCTVYGDPVTAYRDGETLRTQLCSACGDIVVIRRGGMVHREGTAALNCNDGRGDRDWEPVNAPTEVDADA